MNLSFYRGENRREMQDDQIDEHALFERDWLGIKLWLCTQNAQESWFFKDLLPNGPMMLGDVEQIGNPADFGVEKKGTSGEKQPGNNTSGLQQVEPVGPEPLQKNPHTLVRKMKLIVPNTEHCSAFRTIASEFWYILKG